MPLTGTLVNTAAIVAGALVGLLIGRRFKPRFKTIANHAIALSVFLIGMQMALKGQDILFIAASMLLGSLAGEGLQIEQRLESFGNRLKRWAKADDSSFVEGFVQASLIYCVGSMAILGAIEEGINGDPSIFLAKSVLDGFFTIGLASTLGVGVMFSALSVFIYQGTLTLAAAQVGSFFTPEVLANISGVGGLLVMSIGLNVLEVAKLRIGNMLPAIFLVAGITAFF